MKNITTMRNVTAVLLVLAALAGCKSKAPVNATPASPDPPKISDPTPPDPPDSAEVSTKKISNFPAMMLLTVGGVASEGEKDNLVFDDESLRVFRTDTPAADVLAFYSHELKDRGWIADRPEMARSSQAGIVIASYHLRDGQALVLIVAEPEDPSSADLTKSKRHVALMRGTKKSR